MTKDADKMLCCLYKEYLNRINVGASKTSSREFTPEYIQSDDVLSKWHPDDVLITRTELKNLGYITVNIIGKFRLTDEAISYMQNRFKNGLNEVIAFITKLIP